MAAPDESKKALQTLDLEFFRRKASEVAADLLGRYLVREIAGERLILEIVETEAYLGAADRASHAWNNRRTERTRALFRDGGFAYVYLVYGIHHLLNAVAGTSEDGSAVLLRAGRPVAGEPTMAQNRGLHSQLRPGQIAGGPGRLSQAIAVGMDFNGARLDAPSLRVTRGRRSDPRTICRGPRIGVDYAGTAASWKLRFARLGDPHVSRPWPWK